MLNIWAFWLTKISHGKYIHIDNVATKLSKTVGLIAKLRHFAPQHTFLNIHQAFILPYLSYCSIVWGQASTFNKNHNALETSSPFHVFGQQECSCHSSFYWCKYLANRPFAPRGNVTSLVELALAEQDSKNAGISFFSSSVVQIDDRYWSLYYFHEIF